MTSFNQTQRRLRITKDQLAAKLGALVPGIQGNQIEAIARSDDDSTYWEVVVEGGYTTLGNIEESTNNHPHFTSEWLVNELIAPEDPNVQPEDIESVEISQYNTSKIDIVLRRV
jgi:hypothetical protein